MKKMVRTNAEVKVVIYDGNKYMNDSVKAAVHTYEAGRVESFEVVKKTPEEIMNEGFDEVDPFGEYLILTVDGKTATFRNSYVDMFIL